MADLYDSDSDLDSDLATLEPGLITGSFRVVLFRRSVPKVRSLPRTDEMWAARAVEKIPVDLQAIRAFTGEKSRAIYVYDGEEWAFAGFWDEGPGVWIRGTVGRSSVLWAFSLVDSRTGQLGTPEATADLRDVFQEEHRFTQYPPEMTGWRNTLSKRLDKGRWLTTGHWRNAEFRDHWEGRR